MRLSSVSNSTERSAATSTGSGEATAGGVSSTAALTLSDVISRSSTGSAMPDSASTRFGSKTSSPPRKGLSIGAAARTVTAHETSRSPTSSVAAIPGRGRRTRWSRGSHASTSCMVMSAIAASLAGFRQREPVAATLPSKTGDFAQARTSREDHRWPLWACDQRMPYEIGSFAQK